MRELRQNASRYLARVKAGETVEVTERGHLVALLVPPGPAGDARDKLIGTGQLIPGAGPLRLPSRRLVTEASGAVLDELRSEP